MYSVYDVSHMCHMWFYFDQCWWFFLGGRRASVNLDTMSSACNRKSHTVFKEKLLIIKELRKAKV